MTLTTYRNPWHRPGQSQYGPAIYETAAQPVEYRGYLIYRRLPAVFDIVLDGCCMHQCAGIDGARQAIDTMLSVVAA